MKEAVARSVYYFRNRGHEVSTLSGIPHHPAPIFRMHTEYELVTRKEKTLRHVR